MVTISEEIVMTATRIKSKKILLGTAILNLLYNDDRYTDERIATSGKNFTA